MGISTALYNGLNGMNSYATAIAVASDNVANANTTAFKSSSVHFGDLVNSYYTNLTNDIEREGGGSAVIGFATDYGQGSLTGSDNWSDVALNGDGFFVVADSNGNTYYTRDGGFKLDSAGNLVNAQGYNVQCAGADIQIANITNYSKFRVATDGQIWAVDNSQTPAVEVAITGAQIDRAMFTNNEGLVREGSNLYSAGPEIGNTYLASGTNGPGIKFGDVLDSTIEGSNVDIAKEMVDMIIYQASYNANSKTITTSSGLLETSINMVR
jgi:flagellar hook protein FlgE